MVTKCLKLTDDDLARRACSCTSGKNSFVQMEFLYKSEHSPIRAVLFWLEMEIPSFVSVHFSRHKIGVDHFVRSMRDDRTEVKADRETVVTHGMIINAQALMNMARKRLCLNAHKATVEAFKDIVDAITQVDPVLANYLVPECEYRNGYCPEIKSCGKHKTINIYTIGDKNGTYQ